MTSKRQDKKLTIVVPVFNRAGIVVRTLQSIASQDRIEEARLILVDNNSTDNSRDVMEKWIESTAPSRLDVVLTDEPTPGAAAARNRGLDLTETEWIMFFDSDDVMDQGHISNILTAIDRDDADIVGWPLRQQLPSGKWHSARFSDKNVVWNHLAHGILSTQRYAARTKLVVDCGKWDPTVRGWNDLEIGLRLALMPSRVKKISDTPCGTIYFTEESITGRRFSSDPDKWEHSLDLCEKSLAGAGKPTIWVDVRRVILAAFYKREGDIGDARRLLSDVLARHKRIDRAKLRMIYRKHRLVTIGTITFARLFFSRTSLK